jgi:ATP-independent RNA helicase DbpA
MSPDFGSLALSPALVEVAAELGYESLTPIQAQSIPVLLAGKDLIGQSKTGSGKTAAFALPILQNLDLGRREVQALVLCPTRELCAQVAREVRKLGRKHKGLQVLVVSGGEPGRPQVQALARGVHVVVGTPGRVLDHLGRGRLRLGAVATAVLDEADRMLDMGFEADMEKILGALPKRRQTVFFSATFPRTIEAMGRIHQRNPVRVNIAEDQAVAPEIRQFARVTGADHKLDALYWVLENQRHESALIFCNQKVVVRKLTRALATSGVSTECLHGDLEQFDRDRVMAMFRNQSVRVLVATDVAARGLDVADLDLVINYDLPSTPEVYVHRIGRTGRAGRVGLAVSLATEREKPQLSTIERFTGSQLERLQGPAKGESGGRGSGPTAALARPAKMDTIQISGGRKDKVRPGDILGALTGEAGGLDSAEVGKIEIHDRLSYVAVASQSSRNAVDSLNDGRIKGRRFRATLISAARP